MATKTDFIRSPQAYLPLGAQLGLLALPRRCEFVIKHTGRAPQRVLDVGCATGYIAKILMDRGHELLGIELNARMAAEARARGVEVLEHNVEEPFPIEDECIDVVHSCEIIEHLFDTEGYLNELHRVLVPNGVLILSTPNLNSLANRFRVPLGLPLPMWGAFPNDRHGGHVRVFNKAKIVQLLERTGFNAEIITGINQTRFAWVLNYLPTWSELILIKAVRV